MWCYLDAHPLLVNPIKRSSRLSLRALAPSRPRALAPSRPRTLAPSHTPALPRELEAHSGSLPQMRTPSLKRTTLELVW